MKSLPLFVFVSFCLGFVPANAGFVRISPCPSQVEALVIGETSSLAADQHPSAAKDAKDIAEFLQNGGADVSLLIDKKKVDVVAALVRFAANRPEALHLLYLAGMSTDRTGSRFVWFHLDQDHIGKLDDEEKLRDAYAMSFDDMRGLFRAKHVPLILIADNCLGSIGDFQPHELVALAGTEAQEDAEGGFFTQALLAQLRSARSNSEVTKLSSLFIAAGQATHGKSEKQSPVVIWHASSPDMDVSKGKLVPICHNLSTSDPAPR